MSHFESAFLWLKILFSGLHLLKLRIIFTGYDALYFYFKVSHGLLYYFYYKNQQINLIYIVLWLIMIA